MGNRRTLTESTDRKEKVVLVANGGDNCVGNGDSGEGWGLLQPTVS